MIAYASRTGTKRNLAALREAGWRLLVTPVCPRTEGFPYALDNGAWSAYKQGTEFPADRFRKMVENLGEGADFVVVPDIVEGGTESLAFSKTWIDWLWGRSNRLLIAVQDGMQTEDVAPMIGRDIGVFVGGSTSWKLETMRQWGELTSRRRSWLHVGRVNSAKRIRHCFHASADSFDGTSASRYQVTLELLNRTLQECNQQNRLPLV